jgi:hypothetical protein
MPLVAVADHDTFATGVEVERITPIEGVRHCLRHDLGEQVMSGAFPDARMLRQRLHPVPVPGMVPSNLTRGVRTRRLWL